jgi:hypothetical protein
MRLRLAALLFLTSASAALAQFPTPTFQSATILNAPVKPTDATNKAYVDSAGGGGGPFLPLAGGTVTGGTFLNGGGGRSGNWAESGTFTGGTYNSATIGGTWAGNPIFSGNITHQGTSGLNGVVTIGTATTSAALNVIGPSGSSRTIQWMTGGTANGNRRWQVNANTTAESSTATGSDLQWIAFDNTGSQVGTVLTMTRSSGSFNFNPNKTLTPAFIFNGVLSNPTTYGNQFALNNGGTWTIPAGAWGLANASFLTNVNYASSGVVTPSTEVCVWCMNLVTESLQLDDAASQNNIALLAMSSQWGGPGTNPAAATTQGQRIGFDVVMNHSLPVNAASTAPPSALGGRITLIASAATLGAGTLGEAQEGLNVVLDEKPTSTAGSYSQIGVEVDMISEAGSVQPINRVGLIATSSTIDAQGGSRTDIAFGTAAAKSWGFLCQFCIGKPGASYALRPGSTVLGTAPYSGQDGLSAFTSPPAQQLSQPQATNGVELSRVIFNGGGDGTGRAFAAPGFALTDQGKGFFGSGLVQGTSAGLTIDTPLNVLASITSVVGGSTTGKVFTGDIAWDETCQVRGIYQLTVAANVVTAVSVLRPASCATNPATLVVRAIAGGATVNVTWTLAAAQTITLGTTGSISLASATVLAPSLPTSAPGTHCALWSNVGIVTRTTCP